MMMPLRVRNLGSQRAIVDNLGSCAVLVGHQAVTLTMELVGHDLHHILREVEEFRNLLGG